MVKEAEENAEEDKKRREEVELRNTADQLVFTTEKTLKDLADKVTEDEKKQAEDAKEELKKALEANDLEDIKAKKEALEEIVQNLTVKLYQEAQQQAQAAQGGAQQGADDHVVDADYEEVKDDDQK